MKFFTPELYVRGQSSDPAVLDAHEREWDEACDRYAAYLETVRPEMPPGVRRIDESYYLHDARVRSIGRQGQSLVMVLQLDTPPHTLLTFTFDLAGEYTINKAAVPEECRSPESAVEWMYEEWEKGADDPDVWLLRVLFSNGWEVRIPFRDVRVQEAEAVLPVPPDGSPAAPGTPLYQPVAR